MYFVSHKSRILASESKPMSPFPKTYNNTVLNKQQIAIIESIIEENVEFILKNLERMLLSEEK